MNTDMLHLILADDDPDDRMIFEEALKDLSVPFSLDTANDGEQLMMLLSKKSHQLPAVLFLDPNMPRKNGLECLFAIKKDEHLKDLPIIIYSTSLDQDVVNLTYEQGAKHYLRKPRDFENLKRSISIVLVAIGRDALEHSRKEDFIIQA